MPIGFKIVWTQHDIPTGGTVAVLDDHSDITVLCHRPSFDDDPDGFWAHLERHLGCNVNARSRQLALRIAG